MGDLIFLFILCFFVGGLLLWASFTGISFSPIFTVLLGVYFILLPIILALGWTTVFALMVALPLGLFWTIMAFHGITSPFRFCFKCEATYLKPVFDHRHRGRSSRGYYALECRIPSGRHIRQKKSDDWYDLSFIEKRYTPNTTITVWVNKKHPDTFLARRFFGVGSHLLLLLPGIGFLGFGIKLVLDLLK